MKEWRRMVRIAYDGGTGIITVRALAFTPEESQAIAQAIFDESSKMINDLSNIARDDSIRFAHSELIEAVARLKQARAATTAFRNKHQLVDPEADISNQTGLLGQLQGQLAEALIDVEILRETARDGDPRVDQANRRVRVIRAQIAKERDKLGFGGTGGDNNAYADLAGEYESLTVDQQFAEQTYTAALAAYDSAKAEERRQTRYLAAHVLPTLAQKSEYPQTTADPVAGRAVRLPGLGDRGAGALLAEGPPLSR